MFYIIEIEDESGLSVSVVPETWMINEGKTCLWPPVKNALRLVSGQKSPEENWKPYPARILKNYATYMAARSALPVAELTSDLNTDVEDSPVQKRVPVPRKPYTPPNTKDQKRKVDNRRKLGDLPLLPRELDADFEQCGEDTNVPVFDLSMVQEAENDVALDYATASENASSSATPNQRMKDLVEVLDSQVQSAASQEATVPPLLTLDTNVLEKMVRDIATIKFTVQNMDARMAKMEKAIYGSISWNSPTETGTLIPKPFSSLDDFVSFDESLTSEKEAQLKIELKLCGGGSVTEATGRCLRKIITDEVGKRFSLWGKKDNLNFSKTQTWDAVKGAVLSMRHIEPTEKSVEKAAQEWFRHCGDRLKNKKSANP